MLITVFSDKYPLRLFLQNLLDDKLTFIVIRVFDSNGKVLQCAAVLVQLSDLGKGTNFVPKNVELELLDEVHIDNHVEHGPPPPPRIQPKIVDVPVEVPSDDTLHLSARLVQASPEVIPSDSSAGTSHYSGYQLAHGNQVLATLPWTTADCIEAKPGTTVQVKAMKAVGFPSHDTKQSAKAQLHQPHPDLAQQF